MRFDRVRSFGFAAALAALLSAPAGCDGVGPPADVAADAPAGTCPDGYVRVEAGSFSMGSPRSEPAHRFCEEGADGGPIQVSIPHALCVPRTEVTQAQWRARMSTAPFQHSGCDGCPAECVNAYEAAAYCNALSIAEGLSPCHDLAGWDGGGCGGVHPGQGTDCNGPSGMTCDDLVSTGAGCDGYRLPTEAEWEAAARAGVADSYYTPDGGGADLDSRRLQCQANPALGEVAWFCANSDIATHPVGGLAPNPAGLFDMLGNVSEWAVDGWSDSYAGSPTDGSARPVESDLARVVRGGSWLSDAADTRLAARTSAPSGYRSGNVGFRCVRTAP